VSKPDVPFRFSGFYCAYNVRAGLFLPSQFKKVLKIIFEVGEEFVQPVRCPSREREILDNGLEL